MRGSEIERCRDRETERRETRRGKELSTIQSKAKRNKNKKIMEKI